MKITKQYLKQIIKEELEAVLDEAESSGLLKAKRTAWELYCQGRASEPAFDPPEDWCKTGRGDTETKWARCKKNRKAKQLSMPTSSFTCKNDT